VVFLAMIVSILASALALPFAPLWFKVAHAA
jgi:hypothetical protein